MVAREQHGAEGQDFRPGISWPLLGVVSFLSWLQNFTSISGLCPLTV